MSYFFDKDDYSDQDNDDGESRAVTKRQAYASSVLLVYDFACGNWRVIHQSDLSTRGDGSGGVQSDNINEKRGVYVRTSPTIVDLATFCNKRAPKKSKKAQCRDKEEAAE